MAHLSQQHSPRRVQDHPGVAGHPSPAGAEGPPVVPQGWLLHRGSAGQSSSGGTEVKDLYPGFPLKQPGLPTLLSSWMCVQPQHPVPQFSLLPLLLPDAQSCPALSLSRLCRSAPGSHSTGTGLTLQAVPGISLGTALHQQHQQL